MDIFFLTSVVPIYLFVLQGLFVQFQQRAQITKFEWQKSNQGVGRDNKNFAFK